MSSEFNLESHGNESCVLFQWFLQVPFQWLLQAMPNQKTYKPQTGLVNQKVPLVCSLWFLGVSQTAIFLIHTHPYLQVLP